MSCYYLNMSFFPFNTFSLSRYASEKVPLIVVAGKDYGTGSSRDWAAKGPYLLVSSFTIIHVPDHRKKISSSVPASIL